MFGRRRKYADLESYLIICVRGDRSFLVGGLFLNGEQNKGAVRVRVPKMAVGGGFVRECE